MLVLRVAACLPLRLTVANAVPGFPLRQYSFRAEPASLNGHNEPRQNPIASLVWRTFINGDDRRKLATVAGHLVNYFQSCVNHAICKWCLPGLGAPRREWPVDRKHARQMRGLQNSVCFSRFTCQSRRYNSWDRGGWELAGLSPCGSGIWAVIGDTPSVLELHKPCSADRRSARIHKQAYASLLIWIGMPGEGTRYDGQATALALPSVK